jgi:hypothetical protein
LQCFYWLSKGTYATALKLATSRLGGSIYIAYSVFIAGFSKPQNIAFAISTEL